jgi:hypothetical protein
MNPTSLFILTAVIEIGTGLTLLGSPSMTTTLLLGSSLQTATGLLVGRLTGAALLSLGIACWFARHDEKSSAGRGLLVAMLLYNTAAAALFLYAGLGLGLTGLGLWPALLLHSGLAVWCLMCVQASK